MQTFGKNLFFSICTSAIGGGITKFCGFDVWVAQMLSVAAEASNLWAVSLIIGGSLGIVSLVTLEILRRRKSGSIPKIGWHETGHWSASLGFSDAGDESLCIGRCKTIYEDFGAYAKIGAEIEFEIIDGSGSGYLVLKGIPFIPKKDELIEVSLNGRSVDAKINSAGIIIYQTAECFSQGKKYSIALEVIYEH